MKKILLLVFLLISYNNTQAQNTFEKIIDTLGSNFATCIQETFDGGYVYCGESSYNGNDLIIVKLDSVCTVEWAKTYSGPGIEFATYIEQTPDSGYMVNGVYNSGTNGLNWLLRLNANGDTLWTRKYSVGIGATETGNGNSMASVNSTVYGMTGYYLPPSLILSAHLIVANDNGFQLASKIYNPSNLYSAESRAIDNTHDNGFVMAGGRGTSTSTADVYLIRTNTFGDTLWTRTYNRTQNDVAFDVKQTTDSGFIMACIVYDTTVYKYNIWLIKSDAAGDTLWTKQYFSPYEQTALSIEQTYDGGYIMTGAAMNSAMERNLSLIKTNSIGDTLWTRIFNASIDCWGSFVRQTKDGGFIISGISYGSYIIKTDSLGNVASSTGMAEVNNPFVFSVYPNPTSGICNIELKGIPYNTATIEIYNLYNQCIYKTKVINKATLAIDLSNYANGLYMVNLQTKDKIISRKIIIEK